jgi:LmbE family N-acetylglucosaminyl deacetylase
MSRSSRVLVLAAHADDELLGPGAALIGHARRGDEVHVAIGVGKTNAAMYSKARYGQKILDDLRRRAEGVAKKLGFKAVHWMGLKDETLEQDLNSTITAVEKVVAAVKPNIVYMHHGGDVNQDHRGIFKAGLVALRGYNTPRVSRILSFETSSTTEQAPAIPGWQFSPNYYVDATRTLSLKLEALKAYEDEMRPFPHPRSYEGLRDLARVRGAAVGLTAAESFELIREVVEAA